MQNLEATIIDWFISRLGPADFKLREQLAQASIVKREFTAGAGVFLTLSTGADAPQTEPADRLSIDGPGLRSPEMAEGALVTLHLSGGFAHSLEIWSYSGDYPVDRHPTECKLLTPDLHVLNLLAASGAGMQP